MEFDRLPTKQRPKFGKGRTYTPRPTVEAERYIAKCWTDQVGKGWAEHDGEVRVCISIERPLAKSNPKYWAGRADAKKPDVDNTSKLFLDALNGLAFKDDQQVTALNVFRVPMVPFQEGRKAKVRIHIDYYEEEYER